jgi:hypothetical protein
MLLLPSSQSSQSHIATDGRSVSKSWCRAPSGAHDQIFITVLTVTVLFFMGRPLWREDGSVFCICCWPLPAQSFSGQSHLGLVTIFYCFRFETPLFVLAAAIFRTLLYNHFARTMQKTQTLYCWEGVFIAPLHSDISNSIVARIFVAAGICLPSRCLAMNFAIPAFGRHVTILTIYNHLLISFEDIEA